MCKWYRKKNQIPNITHFFYRMIHALYNLNIKKIFIYFHYIILDAQSKQDKHVYFYEACWFSHFAYIYNLMMKCKNRIEKGQKKNPVLKDCFIKIEVIGPYTEENLKLISKRKGELF